MPSLARVLAFPTKSSQQKHLSATFEMDSHVHLKTQEPGVTGGFGGVLTVIYSAQIETPQQKTRGALLPLLVVLFLISYGILTLLVFEQGRTIEAQRGLLQEMLKDSTQLATLKGKLAREDGARSQDKPAAQTEQRPAASGHSENSAPKVPAKEARRAAKSPRAMKEVPQKPAADLEDVRRFTTVI